VNWGATEKAEENLEEFGERGALKLDPLVRGEAATLGAGVAGSVVETGVVVLVGSGVVVSWTSLAISITGLSSGSATGEEASAEDTGTENCGVTEEEARVKYLPSPLWMSCPGWRLALTAKNLPSLCCTSEGALCTAWLTRAGA